jgi:hypothetical protein
VRAGFIEHRHRRVLRIDYSGLSLSDLATSLQQSQELMFAEPPGSVRVLTLWDATLTRAAAELVRRHVVLNTPYVFASAVVTARPLLRVFFESMKVGGRERLKCFDDEPTALDWLAAQ